MGWWCALLAALLGLVSSWWLRTRRYRYEDDEVQRTLSPWWLPGVAVVGTVLGLPFYAGVPTPVGVTYVVALVWAVTLAFIDLEVRRLPDVLTLPAYPVAAVLLATCSGSSGEWLPLARAAACAGVAVAAYFLLVLVSPGGSGLGWGDVKLAGVLAGLLGWFSWYNALLGLLTGFIVGGLAAAVLLLSGRAGRTSHLSFGPAMVVGAYLWALLLPSS